MSLKTSRGTLCLAAALLGAAGLSARAGAQTLSLTTLDSCYDAGQTTVTVAIDLAGAPSAVVGGQFFLQYDDSVLTFVSADPGDAPFAYEIHENAATPGTLDYATGVDPMPPGPPAPGVLAGRMAVLTFTVAGEACDASGLVSFRANTPDTTVTDSTGADLAPTLVDLPAITIDATAPVLDGVPPDSTIECSDPVPAAASPTASDGCDPAPLVSFDEVTAAGACPQASTITRTWTATDACGNSTVQTQVITILDTTPPTLALPADITLECDQDTSTAGAAGAATATDGCDAEPVVGFADTVTPGACEGAYTISRQWTATDACGNTSAATQTITVVDTTAPAVIPPADVTVECGGLTTPAETGAATAVDCDPTPMIGFSDSVAPGDCPQESIITRTWTATDDCGNIGMGEQIITVTDTTAPTVTPPANISIECGADLSPAATGMATATDNCDGAPVVTSSDASDGLGCPETITRTWSATDACGNVGTAVQIITVIDTTAPTFASVPADITIECGDGAEPSNTGEAVGQDNCGDPTVTFADVVAAGACPGSQVITRTWTATDACGLSISADQIITVVDTTGPTVTPPSDVAVECGDSTEPNATGTATASDACDATPVVTYEDSVVVVCGGTTIITRTWSATDLCENVGTAVQTITIIDTTPPVFDLPCPLPDVSVVADAGTCTAAASSVALLTPTATDTCGAATVAGSRSDGLTMADPFPSAAPVTVTWTATDDCGNTATCEQLVTVQPVNQVDIAIDLEFGFEPGPFTRCITFQFFACDPSLVVETVETQVTFTSGVGQATVQIPCGQYVCATARDSRHTLRRTDADDFGTTPVVGTTYVADFTAGGDDDRLIGGNLNDDAVIDILDFGTFIGRFNQPDPADTPCPPTGTNADIDGDGTVFVEDFNFIFVNFLATSEANCCGQPGLAQPVVRISVAELIATGRGDLAVADLNNDGWLDEADIAAYLDGALVTCAADFNHDHTLDIFDLLAYLDAWFAGDGDTDMNADGAIDNFDLLGYVDLWFAGC